MLISTKYSKCTLVPPTEKWVDDRLALVQFHYMESAWTTVLGTCSSTSIPLK